MDARSFPFHQQQQQEITYQLCKINQQVISSTIKQ